jgi:hypothetical protein
MRSLDSPDVQGWAQARGVEQAPLPWSSQLNDYLGTLPWAGHGINWTALPHNEFHLTGATDEQVVQWGRSTVLGKYHTVLLIDNAGRPGLTCDLEDGLQHFDLLFSQPDGYICGVHRQTPNTPGHPVYSDFIEIRAWTTARAITSPTG